jgi:hypothetical protein
VVAQTAEVEVQHLLVDVGRRDPGELLQDRDQVGVSVYVGVVVLEP